MIEKLAYKFDINKLVDECNDVMNKIGFRPETDQIGLKHTKNVKDGEEWYEACGRLRDLFPFKSNSDFTIINQELKGSYIEFLCKELESDYNIGRARIMLLEPRKCMSLHVDLSKRIHVPIITNTDALMIINNEIFHMEADGSAYLTDTTKKHTALNASTTQHRVHLLFDLI